MTEDIEIETKRTLFDIGIIYKTNKSKVKVYDIQVDQELEYGIITFIDGSSTKHLRKEKFNFFIHNWNNHSMSDVYSIHEGISFDLYVKRSNSDYEYAILKDCYFESNASNWGKCRLIETVPKKD